MKTKLETAAMSALLLLLAVLVCPQTVLAQTGYDVQTHSGVPSHLPLGVADTTTVVNNTETATTEPLAEEITQQNQMPLMIVIIVVSFAVYIAVIAVLSSRKIR